MDSSNFNTSCASRQFCVSMADAHPPLYITDLLLLTGNVVAPTISVHILLSN